MSRTLVIGDIHGGLKGLHQVLDRAKVNKSDTLIFLGDYVDGWSQGVEVLELVKELSQTQRCILLRGNHESLLYNWLTTGKENLLWQSHGGLSTMRGYHSMEQHRIQEHIVFLQSLENYYIDKSNRLFVHAGFTNPRGVKAEFFSEYLLWDRTLWELVMAMDPTMDKSNPHYPKRLLHYDEIFIGHTPVSNFGYQRPMQFSGVWNLDTGAAFKGCISIMDVDTKQVFQSDPIWELYPKELGRNKI
ncbi:metallophosphoesterase family protein [Myroides sp. LJL119]